ncbi:MULTISPECIES: MetQ/NlpA family ABC transporter substrate-binding protein [unclassified Acinetobacter]|uniref:MetQ/NlpA family ABC transporter substrate-binding protein n=1 Tax=unclassified Acinetobacter TaxID=196816 RepID=UPI00293465C9|nr:MULTISPECIES: MetQ/NlpA family ABC transporter substrate-binding protein [unclassified Acinetobacter]WOE32479.1 MetQ/NlpA family ABC transporter substrate-binding protein [Acinetobacter sp. SAAs470]WOE37955.1 MetQ/NlpA family ABC transporter substrate-binding protein [Acinetobacter sp. SAAs474]
MNINRSSFELKKKSKVPYIIAVIVLIAILLLSFNVLNRQKKEQQSPFGQALKVHYEPTMIGEKNLIEYVNQYIAPDYGLQLEAVGVPDPVQSNRSVNDGEFAGTIYQHQWWLKQVSDANGFKLIPTVEVYQWAFGIYSDKYKNIKDMPKGATFAVPSDLANQGQALWLLQREGIIGLDPKIEPRTARLKDIIANPYQLKFKEIELLSLARALESVDAAIGYVAQFDAGKIPRSKGILFPAAPRTFAARLVIAEKHQHDPVIIKLQQVFADPRIKTYLETTTDPNVKGILTPVSSH